MRKVTLLIAIGFIFFSNKTVIGQTYLGARMGAFIGTTTSDITGGIIPMDWKTGIEYGLSVEHKINPEWSLLSGSYMSNRGFSINQSKDIDLFGIDFPISARADINLHYLELPIAIKYNLPVGKTNFYGTAGGSIGYATSGNISTHANVLIDINLGKMNIDFDQYNINRFNTSVTIGGGIEHPIQDGKIFLDVRYNHGLSDLIKESVINFDVRNKGFSLGLGYAMQF